MPSSFQAFESHKTLETESTLNWRGTRVGMVLDKSEGKKAKLRKNKQQKVLTFQKTTERLKKKTVKSKLCHFSSACSQLFFGILHLDLTGRSH